MNAARASAILLALAGTALGQVRAGGGTSAAVGTKAAVVRVPTTRVDVRRLALDAFPEINGFDRPKNIQGHKAGLPRVRAIKNTRSNFYRGWTWPRIPDLPQVKAVIAYTNRVVSRAEAARNPSGSKVPTAPGKLRPVRPEDPEMTRRIAALQASPSADTMRDVLISAAERRERTSPPAEWSPLPDDPPPGSRLAPLASKTTVTQTANGPITVTSYHGGVFMKGQFHFPPPKTSAPTGPDNRATLVHRPAHGLIAPRGSIIDELNRSGGAPEMPCGERPVMDRGPLDPRLTDTFTTTPHDVLASQEDAPPAKPGTAALRDGDLVAAAGELIEFLDANPGDAPATRTLALVILLKDVPESAEKSMLEAYRLDPSLASRPITRDDLPPTTDLRGLVNDGVTRANKTNTPQSWLVVSVLMQAQGRDDVAARIMARGRAAGLDPAIADAFDAQLARQ